MQSRHYVKTIALDSCLLKIKNYQTEPKEEKKLDLEKQALVKRIGFFFLSFFKAKNKITQANNLYASKVPANDCHLNWLSF